MGLTNRLDLSTLRYRSGRSSRARVALAIDWPATCFLANHDRDLGRLEVTQVQHHLKNLLDRGIHLLGMGLDRDLRVVGWLVRCRYSYEVLKLSRQGLLVVAPRIPGNERLDRSV